MDKIPKSIKILIVSILVVGLGFAFSLFINKEDYNTTTLYNGKVLNFRDYSYSKDLNIRGFINSFDEKVPEKTIMAILENKTLESNNLTYPKGIQKRVLNQEKYNKFDFNSDFVMIVIPYENKLDMEKVLALVEKSNKNVYFVEEIYDDMMYNIYNLYSMNNKGSLNEKGYYLFEVKNNTVVNNFKEVTFENINEILN